MFFQFISDGDTERGERLKLVSIAGYESAFAVEVYERPKAVVLQLEDPVRMIERVRTRLYRQRLE